MNDWNFLNGNIATIEAMVNVFKSEGNTRTIMGNIIITRTLTNINQNVFRNRVQRIKSKS